MRRVQAFFVGLSFAAAALLGAGTARPVAAALPDPVKAQLIAERSSIAPGQTVWADLHLVIAPGWHVYWRNPGDSGLPTELSWALPAGFQAGAIRWPAPHRFVQGKIGNYGYSGAADLLVPIAAPAGLRVGGSAHLAATASWLVCSEICIPGKAALALDLPIDAAPAPPDPAVAARFAAARARLPKPADFAVHAAVSPDELRLSLPQAAVAGLARPTASFFPYDANVVDSAASPVIERRGAGLDLVLKRIAGPAGHLPTTLAGVVVVRGEGGAERAYTIHPEPAALPAVVAPTVAWPQALLLAFLGGALLNLMPCVFPVLALKLLGFTVSVHRAEERRHALAYAAGIVVSFAAIGSLLLLLRAGGAAIGWGFQLQSPVVVGLLAYLMFALGLSLSGVADFGVGLGGIGGRFADRAGLAGAFATGILAAVVATPCTAPFMGAALGFALVAPTPAALAMILAVGAGLAAPVVLTAAVPGLARLLPRPGPWMLWFKQVLAFPLYATTAWLIWVLMQEVAPGRSFLALCGLVAVGFAVWVYGRTRGAAPLARRAGGGLAAAGAAAALVLAALQMPAAETAPTVVPAASAGLAYQRFEPARLAALVAAHRPVFVNLTAAWCITCLFNERTTLDSAAVRHAFAARGVVALKGDWTRQNPAITAFLQKFGRSGVPLYLYYGAGGTPTVLPQILTEGDVLAAVNRG
jgi:thiol:disulfide interchange protein DsbD